jgi:major vault protein
VIADYDDHKAGDELFITGKEQAIYFQREEHSIIRYGDQTKHYAVAVPLAKADTC